MHQPFASFLLPYAVMAALVAACGVTLELHAPALVSILDDLLTGHMMLFGAWLALAAAGIDYVLVTLHRKLRMGEVGAKSSAQLHLSGRR